MSRMVAVVLCIVMSATFAFAAADTKAKEEAAVAVATAWLGLVDGGEFDKSWDEAASFFKNAVTKDQWGQSLKGVRTPLGNLVSREMTSASYKTSLPGAPDGEYVVIQFKSSFSSKKDAVETVTPMMDKDGKWRVSGYYIK